MENAERTTRHSITETDDVAQALRAAAKQWPGDRDRPGKLLLHLISEGHRAIATRAEPVTAERRAAIASTRGALSGTYSVGYLEQVRGDWSA